MFWLFLLQWRHLAEIFIFIKMISHIRFIILVNQLVFLLLLIPTKWTITKAHHMCFDRFLLAFESRDLSQADKSIIRVSSFPSLVIRGRTFFSVSQQLMLKFSAKWILSILSDLSLTRKTEISVYFLFWMMKLTKTPNCQVLNSFFLV